MNLENRAPAEGASRQSNMELLRIVGMVMITAHHFSIHGGFEFPNDTITINRLWVQFLQMGGKMGVNLFMLLSGYFLISAQDIRVSRAVRLWGQVFSYSILIFAGFVFTGMTPFSVGALIKRCLPLVFSQWWFASTYFILYLMSPYVNMLLRSFDKRQYLGFLLLFGILWCVIPSFTGQKLQSNNLLWYIYMYSFGGCLKLFGCGRFKAMTYVGLSAAFMLLTFGAVVVFDILGTRIPFIGDNATAIYDMQSVPVVVISILLFAGFAKMNVRQNRFINALAPAMFGVYLLHDDAYMRRFLWGTVFSNASHAQSDWLIPYSLLVIALVFTGCALVELTRIHVFEKRCMPVIYAASERISKVKRAVLSRLK